MRLVPIPFRGSNHFDETDVGYFHGNGSDKQANIS